MTDSINSDETADDSPAPLFWRKKPVTIEAVRYLGIVDNTMRFAANPVPDWLIDATGRPEGEEGSIYIGYNVTDSVPELRVASLEGAFSVTAGDWIAKGIRDELYPIKPDIFAATYDPAESNGQVYVGGDGRTHGILSGGAMSISTVQIEDDAS